MHVLDKHRIDVEKIQKSFLTLNPTQCSLKSSTHPSNITRAVHYKSNGAIVDINPLNRILGVDPIERTVTAEPRVTMQELARATLQYGLMVPVLPEFKGITIGGAIMGTGLESASHRFGLFSDHALRYEILLGSGNIIQASPKEHADLFYAIVGSYGSLGILLSVTLTLIPAQPWVKLTYKAFHRIPDAVHYFSLSNDADFLEGFVFAKKRIAIVEGRFLPLEYGDSIPRTFSQKHFWNPWFYQHVKEKTEHNDLKEEKMPLLDYLFRHDRGAFWMGSYGTELSALPRYFLESRWNLPAIAKIFPKQAWGGCPKEPGALYRMFLGWAMSSHRLYTWLHAHSEEWVSNRCLIQDFCIPLNAAAGFMEQVLDETGILPLWLCPISSVRTSQIFSPHWNPFAQMLLNVGVYGIPLHPKTPQMLLPSLEEWAKQARGRKMLYSYSQYTPEQFWEIYPKEAYDRLRRAYQADVWTSIDAKVLAKRVTK